MTLALIILGSTTLICTLIIVLWREGSPVAILPGFVGLIFGLLCFIGWCVALADYGWMQGILHTIPVYEKVIEDTGAIRYEVPENSILLFNSGEFEMGEDYSRDYD